ncbi:hypothetical protein [Leucobacter sp. USHLN153]|uniref:hypothetical protein n=1 Tax=Leucobacter sp. USHLN153 TaxID=3081268 RepID=UPI00301B068F
MSGGSTSQQGEITWARIEDDFFVGSRDGDFLGFIDREEPGAYVVCDQFSNRIGQFGELESAMEALREASSDAPSDALEETGAL